MGKQQFEGTAVTDFQAKLPSATVECDYYPAGTILRVAIEYRVKGVGYEEDKEGNFVRSHKLGIQDIEVVSSYDPSQAQDQVGGSLSGDAGDPDAAKDTGLDVGRTSDQWPDGLAKTSDGKTIDTETGEVIESTEDAEVGGSDSGPDESAEAESETDSEDAREPVEVGF